MEDLDRRLHQAGVEFRTAHQRPARIDAVEVARRRVWWLPVGAAAATAGVVAAVTLALPSDPPVARPRPASASFALPVQNIDDLALGEEVVALTYDRLGQASRGGLQVRARNDLNKVVFTAQTSYANGSLRCLHLDGDWLLWTDFESIPSDLDPGPVTRHSLWLHNLTTGVERKVLERLPENREDGAPCAVGADGTAAWNPTATTLTTLDLDSGRMTTAPVAGTAAAVLPSGVLLQRQRGHDLQFVLRTGDAERVVHTAPGGTDVAAAGDRLLWFEKDPASDTQDGALVRTCTLPTCSDAQLLANDPTAGWGVLGTSFVAWSGLDETPMLRSTSGQAVPTLAPGYVFFRAKAALGATFAYVTTIDPSTPAEKATLHLVTIEG